MGDFAGVQGGAGEKWKKEKKTKRGKEGSTFWVPGELLFRTREAPTGGLGRWG